MNIDIYIGNCLETLQKMDDQSVNTCITSPPYWGLRDYGTAEWIGGNKHCDHQGEIMRKHHISDNKDKPREFFKNQCGKCGAIRKDSQLGLEDTPEEFVDNLVKVFREIKRVLKDDGTVWLNLGDSYSSGGRTTTTNQTLRGDKDYGVTRPKPSEGIKPKDLIGIPWRVALALQADGWYLRQDIIWHKPNPMPESVRDRCTKAHEYIFLLSKNIKYYFDNEAIKEDGVIKAGTKGAKGSKERQNQKGVNARPPEYKIYDGKRNKRSVWTVTTKPFKGAHFATFPMDLIEPCVLAGCPEKICTECDKPYIRKLIKSGEMQRRWSKNNADGSPYNKQGSMQNIYEDLGLQKQCDCNTNETKAGTVLDPFGGSGTTAIVANKHNRNAVLCELNEEYVGIAKERITNTLGMMAIIKEIR
jgi:DNA modification methylase